MDEIETYMIEPYVIAADVYSADQRTGRGGWSWYTGSAAWMYRLVTESLLGFRREGDLLSISPCLHPGWSGYRLRHRHGRTFYQVDVTRVADSDDSPAMELDGVVQEGTSITMQDDGGEHRLVVRVR